MKRKLSMLLATVLALAMMIGMSMTASAYSSDCIFRSSGKLIPLETVSSFPPVR